MNPNFALAYNSLGSIRIYEGEPMAAVPLIEQAMRLDPAWTKQYLHFLGVAYLVAGKYETAAAMFRQRVILAPGTDFSRAGLASALGHLGEIDEARRVWAELKEINPNTSSRTISADSRSARRRTSTASRKGSSERACQPNDVGGAASDAAPINVG